MASVSKILPQSRVLPLRKLMARGRVVEWSEQLVLAIDTLRQNPLRSALTILGIVIGIMTVITVSSVINGLNDNVLGGIRELGSDTIICYRFPWASLSRHPSEWFTRKELEPEWADDMGRLPHVLAATPSLRIFPATIWFRNIGRSPWNVPSEECHPARQFAEYFENL